MKKLRFRAPFLIDTKKIRRVLGVNMPQPEQAKLI